MKALLNNKRSLLALLAFCFFLPIFPKILPPLLIITALLSIKEDGLKLKWKIFSSNRLFLIPVLFYFSYVLSLLYTDDYSVAFRDLETKLSFFLLPFVLSSPTILKSENIKKICWGLTIGCLFASFFCEVRAISNFCYELYAREHLIKLILYPHTNYFFGSYLSNVIHHSYFSMYINFVLVFLILDINENHKKYTSKTLAFIILCLLWLIIFNLFIQSKAGIFIMLILFFIISCIYIFQHKKFKIAIVFLLLSISLFAGYYFLFPSGSNSIKNIINITSGRSSVDKSTTESTGVRYLVWESAIDVIRKNWLFGVGAGDTRSSLTDDYLKKGFTGAYEKKLNAHNQFFQTMLSSGIIGLLFLLIMLLYPFMISIFYKNKIAILFFVNVTLNLFVESMFEVQAGVLFFTLFMILFSYNQEIKPSQL